MIDVATRAGGINMSTSQRKNRFRMVKGHIRPGIGLMARAAVLPEVPVMNIILLVAGITHGWGPLNNVIYMAACA